MKKENLFEGLLVLLLALFVGLGWYLYSEVGIPRPAPARIDPEKALCDSYITSRQRSFAFTAVYPDDVAETHCSMMYMEEGQRFRLLSIVHRPNTTPTGPNTVVEVVYVR